MRPHLSAVLAPLTVLLLSVPVFAGDAPPTLLPLQAQAARVHAAVDGEALTPTSRDAPGEVIRHFLRPRHAERTLDALELETRFQAPRTRVTHLRMRQEIGGLAVYGTYVRAAVDPSGALVWLAENLVTPPVETPRAATIGPEQALASALRELHPGWGPPLEVLHTVEHTTVFTGNATFWRPPTVTRVAVPFEDGAVREGFLVETWTDRGNLLHHTLVSGTGEILRIELRTAADSYDVFPVHPDATPQTVVSGPGSGNAESPEGWLFPGDHRSIFIEGNNTSAFLDRDADSLPDPGGTVVSDGNFLTTAVLTQEPDTPTNQDVSVQNLFYFHNVIHDTLYRHGFTEAAGNFQQDNFGLGGLGGDPVVVEAQTGSGTNGANFSTPTDGSSPRTLAFLWTLTTPRRDGGLDSDILWHEYGHGLTWRMIGSMSGPMPGAVGEGVSDALAILVNDDDVVGEYVLADPAGFRSEPYDGYSRTYGDFTGGDVHFDGEIYAAIQWDLKKRYQGAGFTLDDQLGDLVGGMNFTPPGPAFEDMRDGILAHAPSSRDCLVWKAFAQFGVGVGASHSSSCGPFGCSSSVTEDFTLPAECTDPGGGCTLGQPGDPCDSDADCCSEKCRGPRNNPTCR